MGKRNIKVAKVYLSKRKEEELKGCSWCYALVQEVLDGEKITYTGVAINEVPEKIEKYLDSKNVNLTNNKPITVYHRKVQEKHSLDLTSLASGDSLINNTSIRI